MQAIPKFLLVCAALLVAPTAMTEQARSWPDDSSMAISLSYDDALNSQLDNALPALNDVGFRASFYLTLASPTIKTRLGEWRAAAAQGHELGNHSIFHPCSAAGPERDWVASHYDIDQYVIAEIEHEITVANSFLQAIDGRSERTLTPPCGEVVVKDGSYIPAVRDMFVAIKGLEGLPDLPATLWSASDVSGDELIARVEAEAASGTRLLNLLFHGVGGDHLSVSREAHTQLLRYLADNRSLYWVDSYINIMQQARRNEPEDLPVSKPRE